MRPPHHLIQSQFFQYSKLSELLKGLEGEVSELELDEIENVSALGLPPACSISSLAAMLGVNPGIVWSFQHRTARHYNSFSIKKGRGERKILAPKVALKLVQRWLSYHLQNFYTAKVPKHVFGFVPGRSHVDAAGVHCGARWVYSVDIKNFFPSTSQGSVVAALQSVGYSRSSAEFIGDLCCYKGFLAQGAPTSPVLSNICFEFLDLELVKIAKKLGLKISRYADDVVFSGEGEFPEELPVIVRAVVAESEWSLSDEKEELLIYPRRLKVHGLIVDGAQVRLTKGYRNKLRAYKHLVQTGRVREEDLARLNGHLGYQKYVDTLASKIN